MNMIISKTNPSVKVYLDDKLVLALPRAMLFQFALALFHALTNWKEDKVMVVLE